MVYDMVWYHLICCDIDKIEYDAIWYVIELYDMVWYDYMSYDMVWFNMMWYDEVGQIRLE